MQSQAKPFCLPALAAERSTLAACCFICSPWLPAGMSKVSLKGASTTMTDTSAPSCLASDNPADRARSEGLDPSVAMRIWRYIWVAFPLRRVTRQHDRPQAPNASCGESARASRIDIMPDRIVLMSALGGAAYAPPEVAAPAKAFETGCSAIYVSLYNQLAHALGQRATRMHANARASRKAMLDQWVLAGRRL